jgi:hypothetical protein
MIERANTAGSNDRNRDGARDSAGESEIETAFGAIAIHRRQKEFSPAPSVTTSA